MKTSKYLLCFFIILLSFSCEDGSRFEPPDTEAEELTSEGWVKFGYGTRNSYQNALAKFEEAITKDSNYAEPHCGAGWTNARLSNLSDAVINFSDCISLSSSYEDAHAGLAFVYNAQKEYQLSIDWANETLSLNNKWVFSHDQTVSYLDLYLIKAEGCFALGDYGDCLTNVQVLNPIFLVDVTTIEGRFTLAEEIERLRGIV